MARKKKTSTFDDLIDLAAKLPWWAGVALVVLTYAVLHRLAAQPVASVLQPGHAGPFVVQNFGKTLAAFGQYLLPLICLAGAGISAWRRRERAALVQNIVQNDGADTLNGMTWQQFEQLVGEAFRLQGYIVAETGGGGADGGVDLALSKGREKFVVQCKQWRAFKVGVEVALADSASADSTAGYANDVTFRAPPCATGGAFSAIITTGLPEICKADGVAHGAPRRQRGWRVLGLYWVSGLQEDERGRVGLDAGHAPATPRLASTPS